MAFDAKVEVLTEFTDDPDDPHEIASACFTAAIVYACFLGFCGCQVNRTYKDDMAARAAHDALFFHQTLVHKYNSRNQIQL